MRVVLDDVYATRRQGDGVTLLLWSCGAAPRKNARVRAGRDLESRLTISRVIKLWVALEVASTDVPSCELFKSHKVPRSRALPPCQSLRTTQEQCHVCSTSTG